MDEVAGFDWDEGNRGKCEQHGVSAGAVEELFRGVVAVHPDPEHSEMEERFKAVGRTSEGRYVFVVFTVRQRGGERRIRPISARYMHAKEVRHYEEEAARTAKR